MQGNITAGKAKEQGKQSKRNGATPNRSGPPPGRKRKGVASAGRVGGGGEPVTRHWALIGRPSYPTWRGQGEYNNMTSLNASMQIWQLRLIVMH